MAFSRIGSGCHTAAKFPRTSYSHLVSKNCFFFFFCGELLTSASTKPRRWGSVLLSSTAMNKQHLSAVAQVAEHQHFCLSFENTFLVSSDEPRLTSPQSHLRETRLFQPKNKTCYYATCCHSNQPSGPGQGFAG